MDYIRQLNEFYSRVEFQPLSPDAHCLYGVLLHMNNKCFWQQEFTLSNTTLLAKSGISKTSFHRARNELVQKGYITYEKGRNQFECGVYQIEVLYQDGTANATAPGTAFATALDTANDRAAGPLIKQKQKRKQNKREIDKETKSDATGFPSLTQRFDEFWKAYPKKKAKMEARKAFEKLKPDDCLFQRLMESLQKQKLSADWREKDGKFIPYPATWLNGGRWEDETGGGEDGCGDGKEPDSGRRPESGYGLSGITVV